MTKGKDSLLARNLAWLIAKAKTNPNDLGTKTKVPQPTIHRILIGESRDPRTTTLKPLADFFGVSVSDLRDRDLSIGQAPAVRLVNGGQEGTPPATADEIMALIALYQQATVEGRKFIMDSARGATKQAGIDGIRSNQS